MVAQQQGPQQLTRGGPAHLGPSKGGLSEAKRNAEALFESRTVAEIREIEGRTRKDIEGKKQQLRQLVGDSYRDLIDSADKIVNIAGNCVQILQDVKEIQQGFSFLAHSFTTADSLLNEKRDSLTRHEELYAISGRVRYLVDTPEIIWGYLDSQQYLKAAQRFMRAQLVHQQLNEGFPADMLAKFPLLTHQWPLVQKFKEQIITTVTNCLSGMVSLSLERTADALAGLVALTNLDAQAALQQLLTARRAAFRQQVQVQVCGPSAQLPGSQQEGQQQQPGEARQSGDLAQGVCGVLADASALVQTTISQVGKLFLGGSSGAGGGADPASNYLQLLVREDEVEVGELLFGGHAASALSPGMSASSQAAGAAELGQWHRASKAMQDQLTALSSGVVERATLQWIKDLAEEATQHGQQLLSACTTARQLMEVEASLKAAITSWHAPDGDVVFHQSGGGAGSGPGAAKRPASIPMSAYNPGQFSADLAAGHTATSLASVFLRQQANSWSSICESVLGTQVNLWVDVFQQLFLTRAKQLIKEGFDGIAASVGPLLDEFMRLASAEAGQDAAGRVQCAVWPQLPVLAPGDDKGAHRVSGSGIIARATSHAIPWSERLGPGGTARVGKADPSTSAKGYRLGVHIIRRHVDEQLLDMLQSVLLLLGHDPHMLQSQGSGHLQSHHSGGLQPTSSLRLGGLPSAHPRSGITGLARDALRASELEPYIQARCAEMATSMCTMFQSLLAALGSPAPGLSGAITAEQALLVGRLCSALAWDSKYLGVLLGTPESWRSALAAASSSRAAAGGARGAGAKVAQVGSKLQAVVEQLRSTAVLAYWCWSTWSAHCLVAAYRGALLLDDTFSATTTPLSWQETVISSAGEVGGDSEGLDDAPLADMRFSLPACPSAAMQALITCACTESRRAGDHTAPAEALQVLEWELLGGVLTCLHHLLGQDLPACLASSSHPASQDLPHLPSLSTSFSSSLTEKGVLQLLFDLRLVRDVMAGGRPLTRAGGEAAGQPVGVMLDLQGPQALAALTDRRKAAVALEQLLQDRLDPIDWATYEQHLWSGVKRHYQRCSILYGSLTQLQKVHADAGASRPAAGAGSAGSTPLNPLSVLPVAPRFQIFPIAVPAAAAGHASGRTLMGTPTFVKLSTGADLSGDMGGAYSFADLGTSTRITVDSTANLAAANAASSSMGGAFSASATNALGALQARLGSSSAFGSALGSLLGDKAAEVTAMAQQRFDLGNLSDLGNAFSGGLGTGLLSSLTKGVAKR